MRKREITARIHFIKKSSLTDFLSTYTALSSHDKKFFSTQIDSAYKSIKDNEFVRKYIEKAIRDKLYWRINSRLSSTSHSKLNDEKDITLNYDTKTDELVIELDTFDWDGEIAFLSADDAIKKSVRNLLKQVARYEGKFRFDLPDVPF